MASGKKAYCVVYATDEGDIISVAMEANRMCDTWVRNVIYSTELGSINEALAMARGNNERERRRSLCRGIM